MSLNVTSALPFGTCAVLAGLLAFGTAFVTSSSSDAAWSPPPAPVHDGVCARACEVSACIDFMGDTDAEKEACVVEAASRFGDLTRAGPDQACVQRCELHGAPVDLALLTRGLGSP